MNSPSLLRPCLAGVCILFSSTAAAATSTQISWIEKQTGSGGTSATYDAGSGAPTSWEDTNVSPETAYYYRIRQIPGYRFTGSRGVLSFEVVFPAKAIPGESQVVIVKTWHNGSGSGSSFGTFKFYESDSPLPRKELTELRVTTPYLFPPSSGSQTSDRDVYIGDLSTLDVGEPGSYEIEVEFTVDGGTTVVTDSWSTSFPSVADTAGPTLAYSQGQFVDKVVVTPSWAASTVYSSWRYFTVSGVEQAGFVRLGTPAGFTASTNSSAAVNLAWSAVSGAPRYQIKRSTTSTEPPDTSTITTTTNTSYADSSATPGTSYYYWLRARSDAFDPSGSSSWTGPAVGWRLVSVTVQTNPTGLYFTVDGTGYTSAQTFNWTAGSSHTIAVASSPQNGAAGVRYVTGTWSDGGAQSHTVTPSTSTTYTASFTTQHQLLMFSGAGGTVSPASNWFNSGTSVQISATPNSGQMFSGWTGTGSGSYSGTINPATVTMNGPVSETAAFAQATAAVTVQTSPVGRSFTVDGTSYSSAQTFNWVPGSSHTISTTSPQAGASGVQYAWSSWSDGGALSHAVAPTTATTYTASFTTQYQLTMVAGSGGTVSPASGWRDAGSSLQISATPDSGQVFNGWSGTGSGSYSGTNNPATITVNAPVTQTAAFQGSPPAAPEIVLEQPAGSGLTDGGSTVNFGNVTVGGSSALVFAVRNTGTANLNLTGFPVTGGNASDFTVNTSGTTLSIVAGGSTTFSVTFTPGGTGARNTTLQLASNDADENPFDITLTGTGLSAPAPEIGVSGNGASITSGDTTPSTLDHTDFGSQAVASGSITRTFTIANTGTATLNLTAGTPRVSISGAAAADFTVSAPPAASVSAGGTTTFQVTFDPSTAGARNATVSIPNNDVDENPFTFAITGSGGSGSATSLVLHLPLDGSAADASGLAQSTTPAGITYGADRLGSATGAAWFGNSAANGSVRITVADHATLRPAAYTLAMWVKPANSGYNSQQSWAVLLRKGYSGFPYALFIDKNDLKAQTGVYNSDANPATGAQISSANALQLDRWQHLAATYAAGTCRLYVDGQLAAETTQAGALPASTDAINIGSGEFSGINSAYQGWIDDVRLYNGAMTAGEITSLAGTGSPQALFASFASSAGLSGTAALPLATPRNDGVANLLKYAFNMNAAAPDARVLAATTGTAGLPNIAVAAGSGAQRLLRFEFLRRKDAGLIYLPVKSTTLLPGSWLPLSATPAVTSIDATWERVVVDEPFDLAATPRWFGCIEVTLP